MQSPIVTVSISMSDNTVIIMHFIVKEYNPDGTIRWEREPTKQAIEFEVQRVCSVESDRKPTSWRIISLEQIPPDRTYRNAWTDDGKVISHDMGKVRNLHLEHLRRERAPLLEQKDKEWMRAVGRGKTEEANSIEAQRQALRDLPDTIARDLERAKTPEEVKGIGMEALK